MSVISGIVFQDNKDVNNVKSRLARTAVTQENFLEEALTQRSKRVKECFGKEIKRFLGIFLSLFLFVCCLGGKICICVGLFCFALI